MTRAAKSLYVHVPFCVIKCGYCDFNSYEVDDRSVMDRFLTALDGELALVSPHSPHTVFIGGGTPTYLDPPRFERLLEILNAHVDLASCEEVTVEANPESTTVEKARMAREAGVNRMSIGAQSFDAARLAFLDRAHDANATRAAFTAAREAGFENVSIDLMFGTPGQTVAAWETDLEVALELEPDHLSCYQLTIEPGTRLFRDRSRGRVVTNDEDRDRAMFLLTRRRLHAAGFDAYEVSNFAGRGGPCVHNDHYWRQGDYDGVGPGAASHAAGHRQTNLKPVDAWARSVERGLRPVGEAELLTGGQRLAEAIWLGLRRRDGVDLDDLAERLDADPAQRFETLIERYRDGGWLELDGPWLRLTGDGLLFADAIGEAFLTTDT